MAAVFLCCWVSVFAATVTTNSKSRFEAPPTPAPEPWAAVCGEPGVGWYSDGELLRTTVVAAGDWAECRTRCYENPQCLRWNCRVEGKGREPTCKEFRGAVPRAAAYYDPDEEFKTGTCAARAAPPEVRPVAATPAPPVAPRAFVTDLCIVVRTYPKQVRGLQALVYNLIDTAAHVNPGGGAPHVLSVHVVIFDTDDATLHSYPRFIEKIIAQDTVASAAAEHNIHFHIIDVAKFDPSVYPTMGRADFGYKVTQHVLDMYVLKPNEVVPPCEFVLFTNGDNLYSRYLLQEVLTEPRPLMHQSKEEREAHQGQDPDLLGDALHTTDLLIFDFITGHKLWGRDQRARINARMKAQPKLGHLDLGSVVYRVARIKACGAARFIPPVEAIERDELGLYQQDWHFFSMIHEQCQGSLVTIPEVLLYHQ
eukprot:TRINITY_DN15087_c0_g2_i1.p2 TRINITY_DN15087_c0_g2~~TRINITY_DN15087_c0_g2_i1.p2  ORF type:complete len:466 (+),score=176.19 TRINITY_DN15087_c0_g2_i1:131-1399(+)